MNHKVHSLTIFMANPFSFSQGVFFIMETATPLNQEARILDFVAHSNNFVHAHFCALCTRIRYYYTMSPQGDFKISAYTYKHSPRISIDMNTQWARFARQLYLYAHTNSAHYHASVLQCTLPQSCAVQCCLLALTPPYIASFLAATLSMTHSPQVRWSIVVSSFLDRPIPCFQELGMSRQTFSILPTLVNCSTDVLHKSCFSWSKSIHCPSSLGK